MDTYIGMKLVAIGQEMQGLVRAVYEDECGKEYVIIDGEREYLD